MTMSLGFALAIARIEIKLISGRDLGEEDFQILKGFDEAGDLVEEVLKDRRDKTLYTCYLAFCNKGIKGVDGLRKAIAARADFVAHSSSGNDLITRNKLRQCREVSEEPAIRDFLKKYPIFLNSVVTTSLMMRRKDVPHYLASGWNNPESYVGRCFMDINLGITKSLIDSLPKNNTL